MPSHQGFEFHGGTTQLLCCLQLHVCPGWVRFSSDRLGRSSHACLAHFGHTGKYTSSLGGWGEVATGKNKNMARFSSLSFSVFWMVHLNLQLINTQKKCAGTFLMRACYIFTHPCPTSYNNLDKNIPEKYK